METLIDGLLKQSPHLSIDGSTTGVRGFGLQHIADGFSDFPELVNRHAQWVSEAWRMLRDHRRRPDPVGPKMSVLIFGRQAFPAAFPSGSYPSRA